MSISLLQTTQLIKKITTLKKKREIDTVNQILFVMTLFRNLPDLNWFAATIVFAIDVDCCKFLLKCEEFNIRLKLREAVS